MTEILQIPSTTRSGVTYNLTINTTENKVTCTCTGFQSHGYCKHTRIYKQLINQKIYGDRFKTHLKTSFKNCYNFIIELCTLYPETIGDYDQLDTISKSVLDGINHHYKTETLHRAYRKAVENGEIIEPTHHQIRKEKSETVMHNINQWMPKKFLGFNNPQSQLIPTDTGVEKN